MSEYSKKLGRRSLVGAGAAVAGVAITAKAAECLPTPAQTEGPFYPVRERSDEDWDLTRFPGQTGEPQGQKIEVYGKVVDDNCQPVVGALVDIWQASSTGRYDHPGDPSGLPIDENFQHWGKVLTDDQGAFKFRTVVPGHYPATGNWTRPSHIHCKVNKRGYQELTTQLYFANTPFLAEDRIYQGLSSEQQRSVTSEITPQDNGIGVTSYTLTISKV